MIQPLTRLALQGLAIFFSLQAEVSFPFFSVHIKKNIINQLQEDKGQFLLDGEVNARRGNAYYKVKLVHYFVFFPHTSCFPLWCLSHSRSRAWQWHLNNLGLARFVRSDHLLLWHSFPSTRQLGTLPSLDLSGLSSHSLNVTSSIKCFFFSSQLAEKKKWNYMDHTLLTFNLQAELKTLNG